MGTKERQPILDTKFASVEILGLKDGKVKLRTYFRYENNGGWLTCSYYIPVDKLKPLGHFMEPDCEHQLQYRKRGTGNAWCSKCGFFPLPLKEGS